MVLTLIIILAIGLIATYLFDDEKLFLVNFSLGLPLLVGLCLDYGGNNLPKESNKVIVPRIKIECESGKCDTTYIYE